MPIKTSSQFHNITFVVRENRCGLHFVDGENGNSIVLLGVVLQAMINPKGLHFIFLVPLHPPQA